MRPIVKFFLKNNMRFYNCFFHTKYIILKRIKLKLLSNTEQWGWIRWTKYLVYTFIQILLIYLKHINRIKSTNSNEKSIQLIIINLNSLRKIFYNQHKWLWASCHACKIITADFYRDIDTHLFYLHTLLF